MKHVESAVSSLCADEAFAPGVRRAETSPPDSELSFFSLKGGDDTVVKVPRPKHIDATAAATGGGPGLAGFSSTGGAGIGGASPPLGLGSHGGLHTLGGGAGRNATYLRRKGPGELTLAGVGKSPRGIAGGGGGHVFGSSRLLKSLKLRPKDLKHLLLQSAGLDGTGGGGGAATGAGGSGGGMRGDVGGLGGSSYNRDDDQGEGKLIQQYLGWEDPWLTVEAVTMMELEHFNRLEGTNDLTMEPCQVTLLGSKSSLNDTLDCDMEATWLNLNLNVALVDALLVYGYALIGCVIKERYALQLDRHKRWIQQHKKEKEGTAKDGGNAGSHAGNHLYTTTAANNNNATSSVGEGGGRPTFE